MFGSSQDLLSSAIASFMHRSSQGRRNASNVCVQWCVERKFGDYRTRSTLPDVGTATTELADRPLQNFALSLSTSYDCSGSSTSNTSSHQLDKTLLVSPPTVMIRRVMSEMAQSTGKLLEGVFGEADSSLKTLPFSRYGSQ